MTCILLFLSSFTHCPHKANGNLHSIIKILLCFPFSRFFETHHYSYNCLQLNLHINYGNLFFKIILKTKPTGGVLSVSQYAVYSVGGAAPRAARHDHTALYALVTASGRKTTYFRSQRDSK